jgi:hypothetical protein
MFGLLKRLFTNNRAAAERPLVRAASTFDDLTPAVREADPVRLYYDTMSKMQGAISRDDYGAAGRLTRQNLSQIPAWVKQTQKEYGSFDIGSIPALEHGGKVLAFLGDDDGLAEMRRVVDVTPELGPWLEMMARHEEDRRLFASILAAVEITPGCLQTDLKGLLGEADGHRIGVLVSFCERAGKISRIRFGRSYKLMPAALATVAEAPAKRPVPPHKRDPTPPKLREIDISKLAYVPLPRAPLRWEEEQTGRQRGEDSCVGGHFEIRDARWSLLSVEKLPPSARPDPAFSHMHPRDSGLLLLDYLGKAQGFGPIKAAGPCYDRSGNVTAKAALNEGIYRVGIHPQGSGMIAMSRECVVHAYDDTLDPLFETALAEAPEIRAIRHRFDIADDELKNHVRSVALSQHADRYLFTVVDEAWCSGTDGRGLWGVKLPIKDGWTRVTTPSSRCGTSIEVDQALALMNLTLPLTPEQLKKRYRDLARQWHPDLNPLDPQAGEKMTALNAAAEVLTGIDAATLPRFAGATFMRELDRKEISVAGLGMTMTIGLVVSERFASDWIYAAGFASGSNSVYLAGYSGRVVLVDEGGTAVRVYDIGAVPRRIVDTGRYLYLLTDTRLYILREDALHALIDVFDGGELIVAQTGIGILQKKCLRWYSADGTYLGSILAKDPIRRVYCAGERVIVETRQQRATIEGTPNWWNS